MKEHPVRVSGSITVFLSFVILLVCAMIGVMIEGARIHTGIQRDRLLLETAVDAEFTKYYLPLYEKYHLFFLNQGIDTDTLEGGAFLESIQEYILAGMSVEGGDWEPDGVDLYQSEPGTLTMKNVETAVDEQGGVFLNEVLSYTKYDVVENGCEDILEKLGLFEAAQETSQVLEKKLQTDESMGQLDALILEMMQKVDGVVLRCDGTLRAADDFIKKFAPEGISMEKQGVFHEAVFEAVREKYIDPVHTLSLICGQAKRLVRLLEQKEKLDERIAQEKEEKQEDKEKIKKWKERRKKLKKEISETEDKIREEKRAVTDPLDEMLLSCEEALLLIPKLDEKLAQIQEQLTGYEEVLTEKKNEMLEQVHQEMDADLEEKKEYVGMTDSKEVSFIKRIKQMEPEIRTDARLADQLMGYRDCDFSLDETSLEEFITQTEKYQEIAKDYRTKTMSFDYSGLSISEEVENPLESLQDFLEEGILDLVLPEGATVSDTRISHPDQLYQAYGRVVPENEEDTTEKEDTEAQEDTTEKEDTEAQEDAKEKENTEAQEDAEFGEQLKGIDEEGYHSGITDAVSGFSVSEAANGFAEELLLSQYIKEHFSYWGKAAEEPSQSASEISGKAASPEATEAGQDQGVVSYGVEYVIAAKDSDKKNLKSVMNRILFSRTIFNFFTLMTDAEKKSECYATAAALVGFTGLEPLVRLTQTLILIAWAYEESIVDTAAIFQDKAVPVLKSGKEFQIQYTDLLRISKSLIRSKVKKMPKKGSLLSMDYKDYLTIFLLLRSRVKKCYRSMDLIEQDMKTFYEPDFSMAQCVFGVTVAADYSMPEKFTLFPYVQEVLEKTESSPEGGYGYQLFVSHSY